VVESHTRRGSQLRRKKNQSKYRVCLCSGIDYFLDIVLTHLALLRARPQSRLTPNQMMQYPNMSREIGAKADQPFKEIKMTNSKMPKVFPDGLGEPVEET
jgi:hypothetical protein